MKYVAFFRNLNLGRPHCPTRIEFETAFMDAGADAAQSFLTNGTLVFAAQSDARARKLLASACRALQLACGLEEPAYLRSLAYLADLVAQEPFAAVDRTGVVECCVSFMPQSVGRDTAPFTSARQAVEVLRFTGGEALCIARKVGNTPGSPTAVLEKLFAVPVTTRNWNTVVRLVAKHA